MNPRAAANRWNQIPSKNIAKPIFCLCHPKVSGFTKLTNSVLGTKGAFFLSEVNHIKHHGFLRVYLLGVVSCHLKTSKLIILPQVQGWCWKVKPPLVEFSTYVLVLESKRQCVTETVAVRGVDIPRNPGGHWYPERAPHPKYNYYLKPEAAIYRNKCLAFNWTMIPHLCSYGKLVV